MTVSSSKPSAVASLPSTVFAIAICTTLLPSATCHSSRGSSTLSLGQPQTPTAARPRPDLQGHRHKPLSPHQGRTHSHHCHPHRPPLQRAPTHRGNRIKPCSTTTISGVSTTGSGQYHQSGRLP